MAARPCFIFISMFLAVAISPGLPAEYDVEKARRFHPPSPSAPRHALPQASFSVVRTPQRTLPMYASGSSLPAALLEGIFEHRIWLGRDIAATLTDFSAVCYPDRSILRPLTFIFL